MTFRGELEQLTPNLKFPLYKFLSPNFHHPGHVLHESLLGYSYPW